MRLLLLTLSATLLATAPAAAATDISVSPHPVDRTGEQTVIGRDWPVNEFCRRRVRISLRSDQNAVPLGSVRVRRSGRFRFRWTPADENVGRGSWRVVTRMRCESGDDGSPVFVRRSVRTRVR